MLSRRKDRGLTHLLEYIKGIQYKNSSVRSAFKQFGLGPRLDQLFKQTFRTVSTTSSNPLL